MTRRKKEERAVFRKEKKNGGKAGHKKVNKYF